MGAVKRKSQHKKFQGQRWGKRIAWQEDQGCSKRRGNRGRKQKMARASTSVTGWHTHTAAGWASTALSLWGRAVTSSDLQAGMWAWARRQRGRPSMTRDNQELLLTGTGGKELASMTGSPCPDACSNAAPWRQDTVHKNSIYRRQQGHIKKGVENKKDTQGRKQQAGDF